MGGDCVRLSSLRDHPAQALQAHINKHVSTEAALQQADGVRAIRSL
jgi:hypothetical protein